MSGENTEQRSDGAGRQRGDAAVPQCRAAELAGGNKEKRNLGCGWVVLKKTTNEIAWGQRECELQGSSSFLGSCLIRNIVSCQEPMKQS